MKRNNKNCLIFLFLLFFILFFLKLIVLFLGVCFSDIFEDFFSDFGGSAGGRRRRSSNPRGSDLRYDVSINLEDAYTGKKENISFPAGSLEANNIDLTINLDKAYKDLSSIKLHSHCKFTL